jgi:DNA replication protein DnaC
MPDLTNPVCPQCDGTGMRIVTDDAGNRYAQGCECQVVARVDRALYRAGVPERFRSRTLESFTLQGRDPSLFAAQMTARRFVDTYPFGMEGVGLMLVGSSGLGKTHLAVGILQALILEKRVEGLFFDYHELLKRIQHSYNAANTSTELDILAPIFDTEVLVLDDLGATRPTEWVWDTVAHILNSRYGRNRTTIITTNYPNLPPAARGGGQTAAGAARAAVRDETLGDRIGERMRSRLQEMCVVVEMQGEDRRQAHGRARFPAL